MYGVVAAAGSRFLTRQPDYALYGWLAFGVLVVICIAVIVYRRRHASPREKWELAQADARTMEEEAARARSSEELHEELRRSEHQQP